METEENQEPPHEEQSNSAFITYTREEMNAFMLQPDDVDNPEIKDATLSLMHEAKFPCTEMHKVTVIEIILPKGVTLVFNHQNQLVKVGDRTIKSRQIRFACLNKIENTTSGYEIVISYVTDEKKTRLLHLLNPDNAQSFVASLNSFRRLKYTLYKEMSATVNEFGKALRQSSPIFTGSLENLSVYNLETKTYELQNYCLYLVLDTECLMILLSQFWEDSPYKMYFCKEAVAGSVDKVIVLHKRGIMHVETKKIRLEIPQFKEEPAKTVSDCIRRLRPEPQGSFTGEHKQADYYDNRMDTDNIRLQSFREDLRTTVSLLENLEEIALPWVIAEDEIRRMLDEGLEPEIDIMSGGLDPNNLDHFMKCVEEIEQQLVHQQYDRALSRLQGTKKIFMDCDLKEMKILLCIDDITLLKQMYFHSFA